MTEIGKAFHLKISWPESMVHLLRDGGRGGGNSGGGAGVWLSWKSVSYIGKHFVPSNRKRSKCPGLPTKKGGN